MLIARSWVTAVAELRSSRDGIDGAPTQRMAARRSHKLLNAVLAFAIVLGFREIALGSVAFAQTPPATAGTLATRARPEFDLSTPRRALTSFLLASAEGDWEQAAEVLDLHELPPDQREALGPAIARDISALLDAAGVDASAVPDAPEPEGERVVVVTNVRGSGRQVILRRLWIDGTWAWKFAPSTVHSASELLAEMDRGPLGERMPRSLIDIRFGGMEAWQWLGLASALIVVIVLARITMRIARAIAHFFVHEPRRSLLERNLKRARTPLRVICAMIYFGWVITLLRLPARAWDVIGRAYFACWLLAVGWLLVRMVDLYAERIAERAASEPGWRAREIRTRVVVFRRVMHVLGLLVVVIALLLQFEPVRELGLSLLASAGVAGIVFGLAAQRPLGNLLAGLQLSLTQPLRVGDQVVVEGHFGTVEEIHLSYVVIAVWDERRLILPMTRLLEMPFENWTRAKTDLIGTVLVSVDFSTPFDRVREEVERFTRAHPLFDGRVCAIQVVDSSERSAMLRVLASAADAGATWNLRCAIREFLITLLQRLDHGKHLPRVRIDDEHGESYRAVAAS
jgi:small-conductance mechanosensitive channel